MEQLQTLGAVLDFEDRRNPVAGERMLGRLVALNGMHGIIASRMSGCESSDNWSVGHLITIVHGSTRLVGVVCELTAVGHQWVETDSNVAHVKVELTGEIVDNPNGGQPVFSRGIQSYPELGSGAHRIRSRDLAAIYAFASDEGIEIGTLSQDTSIPAVISVQELISRHFAVVGSTGVGKTTSVAMLLHKSMAVRPNLRVLISDPHDEYKSHFVDQAIVLDSDNLEIPFWMFRFDEILDIIYAGRTPSAEETDALYDLIKSAKARYAGVGASAGAAQNNVAAALASNSLIRRQTGPSLDASNISADTPVPYRISDAIKIVDEWLGQLEKRYSLTDLRTLKNRIEALARDPRFKFMFGRTLIEDNMAKVLAHIFRIPADGKRVAIMQLAGLPNEVVNSVVSVLARFAFDIALWSGPSYEIAVICEEAHRYIPNDHRLGFGPTRQAIGRIAKEGRKYGASLGVVSQRPSELDSTVLSQCSTMFAMRLPNEADKAIIRSAISESSASIVSFLSSIADREAIAFGEAIPTPMRMKFAHSDHKRAEPACDPADAQRPPMTEQQAFLRVIAKLRNDNGYH